jgi:hypothetical protein
MKKMKYIKLFEDFKINESFTDSNFYHISFKNLLDSFKKGVDYKKIDSSESSKSQGGGLYLFSEENITLHWSKEENDNKHSLLLEFNIPKKSEYLEVDVELMNYTIEERKSYWHIYWETFLDVLNNFNLNYYYINKDENDLIKIENNNKKIKDNIINVIRNKDYSIFVVSKDELIFSDISIEDAGPDGIKIKSKKEIGYFQLYPLTDESEDLRDSMESLKKFGIYQKFNQEILPKSNAFRYKGPIIYPKRYKIKDDNGNWGEWINN